uniref:Ig-like domain-containing protein n=1 Tax=Xiphophorus maculatus TaxID=8083 RepID=A0A3B5PZS1_XIPMA
MITLDCLLTVLTLQYNIFLFIGVKCEQLTQPASLAVRPGQPLTLSCQVSYSVSSYWTAFFRHPAGKALEWIGGSGEGSRWTTLYKDSLQNQFSITFVSSTNTATLNGHNMQPEDSAVYYCAKQDHNDTNQQRIHFREGSLLLLSSTQILNETCNYN